jgi:sugar phosphate isomerase/epimerase
MLLPMPHDDIRIGTLCSMSSAVKNLPQILPHGFESFSLTFWQKVDADFEAVAKQVKELLADKAVISCLGFFGNPLQNPDHADGIAKCIEAAHLFGTNLVAGFAGALEDRPLPESMPVFKKVWGELAKRAEDKGVRLAFENCDMGGTWDRPKHNIAHSPTAWEMMFNEVPSPALGLQWEPCHQLVSLIDPLPQLRKLLAAGKVFHVHGKDATIAWDVLKTSGLRGGKPYVWHRTPGFGDTNWTDVISILRQAKWTGSIDIEGWHDPVYRGELEMTGQVHALNYLKHCRGGAFVPNPV